MGKHTSSSANESGRGSVFGPCLAPEEVARYLDRTLPPERVRAIEEHIADCDDCRELVAGSAAAVRELEESAAGPVASRRPWRAQRLHVWLAAAAVLAVAIPVAVLPRLQRPSVSELAIALGPSRPVEGRLAGGFQFGPVAGQTRSGARRAVPSPQVEIAAARLEQSVAGKRDAASLTAQGVARIALGDVDSALRALQDAAAASPADAAVWTDLSAASLEKSRQVAPEAAGAFVAKALRAAQTAVLLKPEQPEAWFNLALAEREAALDPTASWQEFLRREPDPAWAREGRRQLDDWSRARR